MTLANLLSEINRQLKEKGKDPITWDTLFVVINVLCAQGRVKVEGEEVTVIR